MDGCLACEMAAGGGFCSVCICERSASALLAKKSAAACCSGKFALADGWGGCIGVVTRDSEAWLPASGGERVVVGAC